MALLLLTLQVNDLKAVVRSPASQTGTPVDWLINLGELTAASLLAKVGKP